jgi:hypothetical protein
LIYCFDSAPIIKCNSFYAYHSCLIKIGGRLFQKPRLAEFKKFRKLGSLTNPVEQKKQEEREWKK